MGAASDSQIRFELTFDGSKLISNINAAGEKIKKSISDSFNIAGKNASKSVENVSKSVENANSEIKAILEDTERTAKSKASSIAAIYRKQGLSQSDAFKKAWEQIERDSSSGAKTTQRHMSNMSTKSKQAAGEIRNNFSGSFSAIAKKAAVALAAAFSVKKIVDFGKECVNLGSDLAEVQNVVDVTFPKMSAQVDSFAKSAAASFGLSETMSKKFTGTFGAMAKSFGFTEDAAYEMSTSLTGLAGDIASFYNISQDEAYTKLKSVFTGETESLKELGVVMTQTALDSFALANGYGKVTSQMSEAEKVALRYAFVQKQLSAASGDFARTSNSWANQVRVLKLQFDSIKATIGQGLINALTPVLTLLNKLIAKLAVAAEAFKNFTESVFGKSEAGNSVESTIASTEVLQESTSAVEDAADSAAKKMRALMRFDEINKLSETDTSTSTTTSSVAPAHTSTQNTSSDSNASKLNSTFDELISKGKELTSLFTKGFTIGFGDSEKNINNLKKSISGISSSLKSIFTDKSVVKSANNFFRNLVENLGKYVGSMASMGTTLATALFGGLDGYLTEHSEYIKEKIANSFNASGKIIELKGDFYVALADVFSVFGGESTQQSISSLLGIFGNTFLGIIELATKFGADVLGCIVNPFVENKDLFKEALENTMAPISNVLETIEKGVTQTFSEMSAVYDDHIRPMFESFSEGFSEIVATLTEGYNQYFAPVLDKLGAKFGVLWREHIQPVVSKIIDVVGKLSDSISAIWETVLQPLLNWCAKYIMPVVAEIASVVGSTLFDVLGVILDVCSGILTALGGVLDFITGVFTNDWSRVWNGIKDIFRGVWDALYSLIRTPVNSIIGILNEFVRGVISGINLMTSALNHINFEVPDWVTDLTGVRSFGFNLPTLSAPQIPYLAQGGFVQKNTPRLAVIGDNRHEGEIVSPESKLLEMAKIAASTGGNPELLKKVIELLEKLISLVEGGDDIVLNIDGEELARAIQTGSLRLKRRYTTVEVTL